jgi:hypothetical protein
LPVACLNGSTTPTIFKPDPLPLYTQPQQTDKTTFTYSNSHVLATHGDGSVTIHRYTHYTDLPDPLNSTTIPTRSKSSTSDSSSQSLFEPSRLSAPLHTIQGHSRACLSIEYSPTGRQLAVGALDEEISIWDTEWWMCERTLDIGGPVRSLSWSFDGLFICGGVDEVVLAANVVAAPVVNTLPGGGSAANATSTPSTASTTTGPATTTSSSTVTTGIGIQSDTTSAAAPDTTASTTNASATSASNNLQAPGATSSSATASTSTISTGDSGVLSQPNPGSAATIVSTASALTGDHPNNPATSLTIFHAGTGEEAYVLKTTAPATVVAWHPSRYVLAYTSEAALKIIGGIGSTV